MKDFEKQGMKLKVAFVRASIWNILGNALQKEEL